MADQAAAVPVTNGANGTHASAPELTGAASADGLKVSRAQREAADRAAFLAGYPDEEAEKPAPKKAPAKVEIDEDEPSETVADDEESDDEDDSELDEDEDELEEAVEDLEDEAEKVTGKDDPELARRLAQVQKREKRMREQLDARDKAFESERGAFIAEWKPKIDAVQEFEKLKAKIKHDPVGVLKKLGLTEDDLEEHSKITYGYSKAAAADPKNRVAVAELQSKRELRDRVEAAEARAAAIEEKLSKQESSAAQAAEAERYMGKVSKAIGETSPLVQKRLELKPKSTQIALNRVAIKLMDQSGGKLVDPKKVVQAYEKKLRAARDLARQLGDDAPIAATAKPVIKAKASAIKVVDKTASPIAPEKKGTLLPSRTDMIEQLGKLQRGEIDPDAD